MIKINIIPINIFLINIKNKFAFEKNKIYYKNNKNKKYKTIDNQKKIIIFNLK
jgi:hypothetical protein